MKFMVFVPGNEVSESGELPPTELVEAMVQFNESMADAGVLVAGEGLHPTSKGAKVRFDGANRTVIDGPFTEAKELVAGFWIIDVASKEEAIDWVKKAPFDGGVEVEIREIFEAKDFGETLTPEWREREQQVWERAAAKR